MRLVAACSLLVIAGCAKQASKQEPATAAPPPPTAQSQAAPPAAPAPEAAATATAPGAADEKAAKEAARSQGLLGPSDQDAFRPLDEQASGGAPKGDSRAGGDAKANLRAPMIRGAGTAVVVGAPVLGTNADGSAVTTALRKRQRDLDRCYATARSNKATLAGELTIELTIKPDGKLEAATIAKSTLGDAALETCILGVVQSTKLAKPLGTSEIKASLPITFSPPAKTK